MFLHYANLPGMEEFRELMETNEPKGSHDFFNTTKMDLRITGGIITGYCRLHYHLKKMGISTYIVHRLCREAKKSLYISVVIEMRNILKFLSIIGLISGQRVV